MPKNWLKVALIGFIAVAMGLQGCGSKGGGTYSTTAGQGTTSTTIAGAGSYTVKRGDTLYGISRSTGVPLRSLIDANGLVAPYTLVPGQVLALPAARVHTVAQGDTVYGISRRYGVEMSELARTNNLEPPYTIKPGQQLALPSGATGGELASAPASPAPSASDGGAITGKPLPAPAPTAPTPLPSQPQPQPQPEPAGSSTLPATPPATPTPAPAPTTPAPSPAPTGPKVIPDPPARVGGKFAWPVDGTVVSNFGPKEGGLHNDGINIAAPRGTPVLAAENGVVAYAGSELKGFGNLILIKHEGGYVTAYAHNDQLLVTRGDIVRRGETIARVGSTGGVDSPQLHFEIRKGSKAIDPMTELAGK